MTNLSIRDVRSEDSAELADLLNAIIAQGGTTALETAFSAAQLDEVYLTGPDVLCCFVAANDNELVGFQTVVKEPHLPDGCADIATFAQIDGTQKGIGTHLFSATKKRANELGLTEINACIRADNVGGLAFYSKQGFRDHSVDKAIPLNDGTPVDRINKRFSL
ncbi:MAG: GNAT family N-acetyltransferase [Parasphingorhabdus sp.]